jgi:hypothetical protein
MRRRKEWELAAETRQVHDRLAAHTVSPDPGYSAS